MKHALSLVCIVLVAALATGCKSGTAGKVISVQVSPTDVNVVISTTLQFSATVTDTNNRVVTWSVVGGSANGTISSTGLYTAPATVPSPAHGDDHGGVGKGSNQVGQRAGDDHDDGGAVECHCVGVAGCT